MWVDVEIFRLINNLVGKSGMLDAFGIFAAVFLLPFLFFLLIPAAFSIKKLVEEHWWEFIIKALTAAGISYLARTLIAFLFFRPRPFVFLQDAHQLISKGAADGSFPSAHATAAFALAFMVYSYDKGWGWVFMIIVFLISLSRVFVGVHYPSDILAGCLLGYLSALVVRAVEKREWSKLERRLKG